MKPFDVYPLMDVNIQRGLGSYVWDQNGRPYLDFYGGHAVISIGHSHPHFLERIKKQLDQVAFYSNFVQNDLREELALKVGAISNYPDYQLFLVNSGAEAIENAIKLASFKNGRTKIIAFERGFHGRTSAAVHITDNKKISAKINQGFERVLLPWNDAPAASQAIAGNDVCAVVIEGVQGIGGVQVPNPEFLQLLEKECRKTNTVLILDEIQSGYGRTAKFFAHQYAGIQADLVTIAKGMGNGFPIGGVLIAPDFEARSGLLGTTFGGTHLACAAGLAVVEVLEKENLIENARLRGIQIKKALSHFSDVKEVRGMGCMIGVQMPFPVRALRKQLIEDFGVFTGSSSQLDTLRILPPLSVSENEVNEFINAFAECIMAFKQTPEYESFLIKK